MRKPVPSTDAMWSELCMKHRQWEDMVAKGCIKMKKKINKQGHEYYDFDFSRYQYYYSFPQDHISLASPITQKKMIQNALQDYSQDFTSSYLNANEQRWEELEKILRPYQFHTLLNEMRNQFEERITMLRIQKTLRIKEMKEHFTTQNYLQKSIIELMDSEIRSYCHKLIRIDDIFYSFGESFEKRASSLNSNLKMRTVDELQVGNVDKAEVIIFLRSKYARQSMSFNVQIMKKMIESIYSCKKQQIMNKIMKDRSLQIKKKRETCEQWKQNTRKKMHTQVEKVDSSHFQSMDNKIKAEELLQGLDYFSVFQKNVSKSTGIKYITSSGPVFTGLDYNQFLYRPKNRQQVKSRLRQKCLFYFEQKMLDEQILKSSDEHICYKINNLCFLQLKSLWESYDSAMKFEEGNLIKIRNLMKMQLNLVFSRNIDKLLNIKEHSIKIIAFQKWYPNVLYQYSPRSEKESIMIKQLANQTRFKDPLIVSFISLLDVKKDSSVREQIQKYMRRIITQAPNVYCHQYLFYQNCCQDEKKHLINVLNKSLSINQVNVDPRIQLYLQALFRDKNQNYIPDNMLSSYYTLTFLRCVQNKYKLLQILNAQRMCMIKVQNRVKLFWKKGKIPFHLSKQFITRFTESNDTVNDPFDFVKDQSCDIHLEEMFKEMKVQEIDWDQIVRINHNNIQVRRKKSGNILLEGKSIIYEQSFTDLQVALQRIQLLCSNTIKFRQQYLPDGKITQLVDRIQLIFTFLQKQMKFQEEKLKLLEIYDKMLLQTVSSEGIKQIYKQMHNIKLYDNIADMSLSNYCVSYDEQTKAMHYRIKILEKIAQQQRQFESKNNWDRYEQQKRANLSNKAPQLSSLYYIQEIVANQNQAIEEESEQDMSQIYSENEIDSQHNRNINLDSEISSVFGGGSQYHLKVSFQEILSKNNISVVKTENSKKQQLLNRKRQRLINDTILGYYIPRDSQTFQTQNRTSNYGKQQKAKYTYFTYYVLSVMRKIQNILTQNQHQSQFCAAFLQETYKNLQNYQFQNYNSLIRADQLPLALGASHKVIQKFMDRNKTQNPISNRNSNDHMLAIPSQVMKKIIKHETGNEISDMRGLYISLNYVHINQIHFLKQINRHFQKTHLSHKKMFNICLQTYSKHKQGLFHIFNDLFEKIEENCLANCSLMNNLKQTGDLHYFSVGNYMHYFKALSSLQLSLFKMMKAFNQYVWFQTAGVSQLLNQLTMLDKFQCHSKLYKKMHQISNITNRVFIRKKIEFLQYYQRTFIKKQVIEEMNQLISRLIKIINTINFSTNLKVNSVHSLVSFAEQFENLISKIIICSITIQSGANQISAYLLNHQQINKIKKYTEILPFIQRHLQIQSAPDSLFSAVFSENTDLFENLTSKFRYNNQRLIIKFDRLSFKNIALSFFQANQRKLEKWIETFVFKRKRIQCVYDPVQSQYFGYNYRHCQKIMTHNRTTLRKQLQNTQKYCQSAQNSLKLRLWFESQFIIFGCTLKDDEQHQFRKILLNPLVSFQIFWNNKEQNLINPRDLTKIRGESLNSDKILERYKQNYMSYEELRKKYASFLQDISQFTFQEELSDVFLVIYSDCRAYFNKKQQNWSFLSKYASTTNKNPENKVDQLYHFIYGHNPARLSDQHYLQWHILPHQFHKTTYDINKLKFYAWNSIGSSSVMKKNDQSRRFMKYKINDLIMNMKTQKPVSNEVALCFYRKQRLKQLLQFLNIDSKHQKVLSEDFNYNFDRLVEQGHITLHKHQSIIFNLIEKDTASKREFVKIKDDIMQIIMFNQFADKLIRQHFFKLSIGLIDDELSLRKLLIQNTKNQVLSNDHLIMKQTMNKILIPKVKLNPFLASPLKCDNYFFAGTAKLSFVDQFLNKLRNRAVLIELAEGGTGYLLKVNQLDDSVNSLCKAIVGFSQKQFNDRLRTVYEAYEDLRQKFNQQKSQKLKLKTTIQASRFQQRKYVQSLVYEKLTDYIVKFHEHNKAYDVAINLLKSLQNKFRKQLSQKYQSEIQELKIKNVQKEKQFKKFSTQYKQIANSQLLEAKDYLYESFKGRAEDILNKSIIQDLDSKTNFESTEQHDSAILMQKLKMQKGFYEIKIHKLQSQYSERMRLMENKLIEQNKLQNLLMIEQQKVNKLTQQIKQLQRCSIQNQMLKKQMGKKDEEQTMQKFRLVKVNQSLRGKIKRIEQQKTKQLNIHLPKVEQKLNNVIKNDSSNFLIENQSNLDVLKKNKTAYSDYRSKTQKHNTGKHIIDYKKKKSFYIKTQGNELNLGDSQPVQKTNKSNNSKIINANNIWREKWLKNSQNLQEITKKLKSIMQYLMFTKNIGYTCEQMGTLIRDYDLVKNQ